MSSYPLPALDAVSRPRSTRPPVRPLPLPNRQNSHMENEPNNSFTINKTSPETNPIEPIEPIEPKDASSHPATPNEPNNSFIINKTSEKTNPSGPEGPTSRPPAPLAPWRAGPWPPVRFPLHVPSRPRVYLFVSHLRLLIGLLGVSAFASDPALDTLLKSLESRYNQAKTLQVQFHEDYTPLGRPRRSESGTLLLRRPGKMRWDYDQPKGMLFVSDGKFFWLYTPAENRAEKMKLRESDDMRVPLAFLLGKLNFQKEFRNVQATPDGPNRRITAEPKTDNLPYSAVEFVVAPDTSIRVVKVTGFDRSTLEFHFDGEKVDPKLDDKLFRFELPKGAELVEEGR